VVAASLKPGEVKTENKRIVVGTTDKALEIQKLKPSGKNEMSAEAFLAGYKL